MIKAKKSSLLENKVTTGAPEGKIMGGGAKNGGETKNRDWGKGKNGGGTRRRIGTGKRGGGGFRGNNPGSAMFMYIPLYTDPSHRNTSEITK